MRFSLAISPARRLSGCRFAHVLGRSGSVQHPATTQQKGVALALMVLLYLTGPVVVLARPIGPVSSVDTCASNPDYGFPIAAKIISNKPFLRVRINGSRPLEFLLDTGSAYASVDKRLTRELGFTTRAESHYSDSIGPSEVTETALEPSACEDLAGARLRASVTAMDLSRLSSVEGVAIDGLLGGDFLTHYIVAIDYTRGAIQIFDPSFQYTGSGTVLPVSIEDGQIFTQARLKTSSGRTVEAKLCVDTGARMSLLLTHRFAVMSGVLKNQSTVPKATIGFGFGGKTQGTIFRLQELALGPLRARDISSTISLQSNLFATSFPDVVGILGGGFLRHYRVFLDYPHRRIILETTSETAKPFASDASGMFLVAEGPELGSVRVLDIVPRGPADAAGIRSNDILESIDTTSVAELGLEGVRQMFQLDHVTHSITVKRREKTFTVVLQSADLLATAAASRSR